MENNSSKEILSKEIKLIFHGRFPDGYINNVDGWGISKEELHTKLPDGTYKLLTLDIDFGSICSLACPHCFKKSKLLSEPGKAPLSYEEMISIIKQGKSLGLKSVKFLGAGEPFENPDILRFLQDLRELDIKAAIFTKGHVLGSDELTNKYFGQYGIKTADQLVERLKDLDVSILLGFNSFRKEIQEDFVGLRASINIKDYVKLRNNALIKLVRFGFNKYIEGQATRLALIAAPIKPENVDEIFEIYEWGRVRNMYVLGCPTTYSGLGKNELSREQNECNFEKYIKDIEDLYVKIYKWNIKTNLMSLKKFEEEGCSLYPGCHPCNQVAAGFYITIKGKAIRCPGRDDENWVISEDIRGKNLKEVWVTSQNYILSGEEKKFNFHCIARDGVFFKKPVQFYTSIRNRVLGELKNE